MSQTRTQRVTRKITRSSHAQPIDLGGVIVSNRTKLVEKLDSAFGSDISTTQIRRVLNGLGVDMHPGGIYRIRARARKRRRSAR